MSADRHIQNIVRAIMGPIIVADQGWGETLPDWIRTQIKLERLTQNMRELKGEKVDEATDAEALAYFYTLSLRMPLTHEGFNVYMYLVNKYRKLEEGIKPIALGPDEERLLSKLKRFIYRDAKKAFKMKLGAK